MNNCDCRQGRDDCTCGGQQIGTGLSLYEQFVGRIKRVCGKAPELGMPFDGSAVPVQGDIYAHMAERFEKPTVLEYVDVGYAANTTPKPVVDQDEFEAAYADYTGREIENVRAQRLPGNTYGQPKIAHAWRWYQRGKGVPL